MEKLRTIEDIKNSGIIVDSKLQELMQESLSIIQNNNLDGMDITDTPISPNYIEDDDMEIVLTEEVTKEYKRIVQMINNPSTALEYPMVLLGRLKEADGIRFYSIEKLIHCSSSNQKLNSRVVNYDQDKLNDTIKLANRDGYNFVSLCHTHPNISQEERTKTVGEYLSGEQKENFAIRDTGLNISLQDFVQYESIHNYYFANPNVRTFETIIMYNGEIAMFGKVDGKYKKMSNIYNGLTFENIPVYSSKESVNKNIL